VTAAFGLPFFRIAAITAYTIAILTT